MDSANAEIRLATNSDYWMKICRINIVLIPSMGY